MYSGSGISRGPSPRATKFGGGCLATLCMCGRVHGPDPRLVVDVGLWIAQRNSPRDYVSHLVYPIPQLRRWWIRVHGLSDLRYGGSGGFQELQEELEAENEQIRCLRSTEARTSYRERQIRDSSVVVPVSSPQPRRQRKTPSRSRAVFPFPLFLLSSADWGEGDQEAPLGRRGSPWVAADDTGREWDFFSFFL